jgi:hypothetical protein
MLEFPKYDVHSKDDCKSVQLTFRVMMVAVFSKINAFAADKKQQIRLIAISCEHKDQPRVFFEVQSIDYQFNSIII